MDYQLVLLFITGLVTAFMAVYIFLRSPQGEIQRSFIILISFFVLWVLLTATVYSTSDLAMAAFMERVTYILGLGIAWSFLNFAMRFPYKIKQVSGRFLIASAFLSLILFFAIVTLNGLITRAYFGVNIHDKFFVTNFYWLTLYILLFLAIFLYAFYLLARKYRDASGEARHQIKYVFITTLLSVCAGLVFNLLPPYTHYFRYEIYGPSFTLPFTLVVTYLVFLRSNR